MPTITRERPREKKSVRAEKKTDRTSNSRVKTHLLETYGAVEWKHFAPLVNIQTSGTVKPFNPYEYQIDLIRTVETHQNTVICKSRQMGISETLCCYLLMRAVTEEGFAAVVFSKTQKDASDLATRIADMAVSLGALCPAFKSMSKTLVSFKGLGRIYFLPVTARAARGIPSVSVIVFDEAAFIDGIDGVYQAAMPTLSMLGDRGKVIFNSTPNGKAGLFYRLLTGGVGERSHLQQLSELVRQPAENNIVEFKRHSKSWSHKTWAKVLLHWRAHPIYGKDPDWAIKTREERELTEAQWDVEYELDFGQGSNSIFREELIQSASRGAWEEPDRTRSYLIGVDPNLGGNDYFDAQVWDITEFPYSLVAEYRERTKGKEYNLSRLRDLVDRYRPTVAAIESNNGGVLYAEDLIKDYSWLRVETVSTTAASKTPNTDRLVLMHERGQIIYPADSGFAIDAPHFVERLKVGSTGRTLRTREAESGHHDDGVMAAAIGFAVIESALEVASIARKLKALS